MEATLHSAHDEPSEFTSLAAACQAHFDSVISTHGPNLFTVDAGDLYATYLDNLPPEERQPHNCHCCKSFIKRFGNLVAITNEGQIISAMWGFADAPSIYAASIKAMSAQVARANVTGVFLSSAKVWGTPEAGGWNHFAITPPAQMVYRRGVLTAGQAMAAKREDFRTLNHGLAEFSRDQVAQALTLLQAESLYRSEKVIGPARFLLALHDAREGSKGKMRDNITWLAVAGAPVGFCTPRSSMIGTLLEDIAAGMDFDAVKRRFDAKMNPLQYQRPQAAPAAGNIAQAEKLVAELGLEPALHRRYARVDEIQAIWRPTPLPERVDGRGVFGHVQPKGKAAAEPMDMPAKTITWEKFRRTVLADAKKIEHLVSTGLSNYCGIVTATNADAPPILQWDHEDARNPFSWYLYNGGSSASAWGLVAGQYVEVTAVTLKPSMWAGEDRHQNQGKGAIFVLDGARDQNNPSMCLFPETLKSELHQVRATIEAYSRKGQLDGEQEASANGIMVGDVSNSVFRVTTSTGVAVYKIDRWD